ncbi:hypothetical protein M1N85_00260 [Dehalococcoidia bacterium]|nr:hypothetical protein [Dehalococcoidia bacterium]
MKTKIVLIPLALLLAMSLVAIGCPADQVDELADPVAEQVLWSIAVEGVEGVEEFTNIDAAKLNMIEIDVIHRRRDVETPQTWTGILLRDIMEYLGVAEFQTVTIVAGDGFTAEYTPEIVNADDSILGFLLDGEELDEDSAPARTVIGTRGPRYWVRNVVTIVVNK